MQAINPTNRPDKGALYYYYYYYYYYCHYYHHHHDHHYYYLVHNTWVVIFVAHGHLPSVRIWYKHPIMT